jgi:adapter protein MecA 1/2
LKIERISENQIRCTLTREDLSERQIELSELAYGSEKARKLFHEMIQAAADEVGFDVENMPIMVEAIPINMDNIMLIVTRVEDPDELDARFSRFSPSNEGGWQDAEDFGDLVSQLLDGAQETTVPSTSFSHTPESCPHIPTANGTDSTPQNDLPDAPSFRMFSFSHLDEVIVAANAVKGMIPVQSTLYKMPEGSYTMVLYRGKNDDAFHRICNTLSEYGTLKNSRVGSLAYCEEHCEVIIASRALDKLGKL